METLHFSIEGEFVTNFSRDLYWLEKRDYKEAEKLLLCCLHGTDQSEEELKKIAKDILMGRKKLTGNSAEGLSLEDDTFNPNAYHSCIPDRGEISDEILNNIEVIKGPDYGWLSPTGIFHPVDWGNHEKFAREYFYEHYYDEFDDIFRKSGNHAFGDALVYKKRWVLLHNPQNEDAYITCDTTRLTRAQKEFLYDYLSVRHRYSEADEMLV